MQKARPKSSPREAVWARGKLVNKSVVRPTFSYLGDFFISDKVLTDIAECVGLATDGVASVDWVFENTSRII